MYFRLKTKETFVNEKSVLKEDPFVFLKVFLCHWCNFPIKWDMMQPTCAISTNLFSVYFKKNY